MVIIIDKPIAINNLFIFISFFKFRVSASGGSAPGAVTLNFCLHINRGIQNAEKMIDNGGGECYYFIANVFRSPEAAVVFRPCASSSAG